MVTLFAAHESRDETVGRSVDIPGIAALTVALTALVFALVEGNAWGWGSPGILGLLALSVVAFVGVRRRSSGARRRRSSTSRRCAPSSSSGANIVAFMVSFGMLAMFFFLALYMQNILGYSPLEAGVRFLPSTVVIIVAGPIAGRLADRFGPRPLMVAGLLIVAVSLAWQSRIEVDTSYSFLVGAFVLMGLGMGLVMSPMSMAAMNAVDRTKAGVASGTLSMFRMVGGTFGVAGARRARRRGRPPRPRAVAAAACPGGTRDALVDGLGSGAGVQGAPREVVDRDAGGVRRRARHRPDDQRGRGGGRRGRGLVPHRPRPAGGGSPAVGRGRGRGRAGDGLAVCALGAGASRWRRRPACLRRRPIGAGVRRACAIARFGAGVGALAPSPDSAPA